MATGVAEPAWAQQLPEAKRRRLADDCEQDSCVLSAACWQQPACRAWSLSPADSDASADTLACALSPGACLPPAPSGNELLACGGGPPPLRARHASGLQLRFAVDYLTPPGQRLVVPQPQPAPQLRLDFGAPAAAARPQPLPAAGTKRFRLESQAIAERIASFEETFPPGLQPLSRPGCGLGPAARFSGATDVLQPRLLPADAQSWAAALGRWSQAAAQRSFATAARPPPRIQAPRESLQPRPQCLGVPPPQRAPAPRAPANTPARLLEHWAAALRLEPDTVRLTLHMYGRLAGKMRPLQPGHGALLLLGCLWLAAKHEECRVALPTASRLVALVGGPGVLSTTALNRAELLVLDLLGWQPLQGWDDALHAKGRRRPEREVAEAGWLRLAGLGAW